jgi:hypothetical protein
LIFILPDDFRNMITKSWVLYMWLHSKHCIHINPCNHQNNPVKHILLCMSLYRWGSRNFLGSPKQI